MSGQTRDPSEQRRDAGEMRAGQEAVRIHDDQTSDGAPPLRTKNSYFERTMNNLDGAIHKIGGNQEELFKEPSAPGTMDRTFDCELYEEEEPLTLHTLLDQIDISYMRRRNLLIDKSRDYADKDDVLAAFKRVAVVVSEWVGGDVLPSVVASIFIATKLDRINNIINYKEGPVNESLQGSYDDLHNYIEYHEALVKEMLRED